MYALPGTEEQRGLEVCSLLRSAFRILQLEDRFSRVHVEQVHLLIVNVQAHLPPNSRLRVRAQYGCDASTSNGQVDL